MTTTHKYYSNTLYSAASASCALRSRTCARASLSCTPSLSHCRANFLQRFSASSLSACSTARTLELSSYILLLRVTTIKIHWKRVSSSQRNLNVFCKFYFHLQRCNERIRYPLHISSSCTIFVLQDPRKYLMLWAAQALNTHNYLDWQCSENILWDDNIANFSIHSGPTRILYLLNWALYYVHMA